MPTPQFQHHPLQGISEAYRHIIRGYLVHFHANIMRHSTRRFNYRGGSIGNFFFAGTRIFFRWVWGLLLQGRPASPALRMCTVSVAVLRLP